MSRIWSHARYMRPRLALTVARSAQIPHMCPYRTRCSCAPDLLLFLLGAPADRPAADGACLGHGTRVRNATIEPSVYETLCDSVRQCARCGLRLAGALRACCHVAHSRLRYRAREHPSLARGGSGRRIGGGRGERPPRARADPETRRRARHTQKHAHETCGEIPIEPRADYGLASSPSWS